VSRLALAQAPVVEVAPLATELVKLLDTMKLDSVAGSRGANEYVAAMYFPGSQLVVVNAKTTVPDRMKYLILQKSYKDLYVELNGAVDQASKTFISDLGANGLQFKREKNQPFDTVDATGKTTASTATGARPSCRSRSTPRSTCARRGLQPDAAGAHRHAQKPS
jgi:hypothetical protein